MKTLITIMLVLVGCSSFAQGKIHIQKIDQLCTKSKRSMYPIVGKGYLLHMKCKEGDGGNFFIMMGSVDANSGILLNNQYKLDFVNLKVDTFGKHFFRVRSKGKVVYYQYDFKLDSWTRMDTKPPDWRTGDRE